MDDFSAIRAADGDEEVFQAHGLKCRLWRNRFGAWCGYVIRYGIAAPGGSGR